MRLVRDIVDNEPKLMHPVVDGAGKLVFYLKSAKTPDESFEDVRVVYD